jgi:hypothetical protein
MAAGAVAGGGQMSSTLTNGQLRDLGRALVAATLAATCVEELPQDAWLDVRLLELGCPEDQLKTYRAQIRSLPLQRLADGAT